MGNGNGAEQASEASQGPINQSINLPFPNVIPLPACTYMHMDEPGLLLY